MARRNVYMLGEPVRHGLIYSSCFFKRLATRGKAERVDVSIIESNGSVSDLDAKIEREDPIVFYSVGHGQCCVFTGECTSKYIECCPDVTCSVHFACWKFTYDCKEELRLDKFRNRHVHLLSCVTARNLGPALINHGAKSYIGYDHLFVYGVWRRGTSRPDPCTLPGERQDFFSFTDSDCEGEREILLHGKTVGEAFESIHKKFREYIYKYSEGEWKDREIAPGAERFLRHDLKHLVVLGDRSFRPITAPVVAPPLIPVEWAVGGATLLGGMMLGGIAAHHEEIEEFFSS